MERKKRMVVVTGEGIDNGTVLEEAAMSEVHPFAKMQAVGNDFVVVEECLWPADIDWNAQAIRLCDRKFGIGGDGLLVVCPSEVADIRMRMFNPDGTEEMCGNGLRCVIRYAYEHKLLGHLIQIPEPEDSWMACLGGVAETLDGLHPFELSLEQWGNEDTLSTLVDFLAQKGGIGNVHESDLSELSSALAETVPAGRFVNLDNTIELHAPKFAPAELPMLVEPGVERVVDYPLDVEGYGIVRVTTINTGSTYTVLWGDELSNEERFIGLSSKLENHPAYPERTTVLWAKNAGKDEYGYPLIQLRIWKRGVGETLGCGTGACAVVIAAVLQNIVNDLRLQIRVQSRGGILGVYWPGGNNDKRQVLTKSSRLEGPAFIVYEGVIGDGA